MDIISLKIALLLNKMMYEKDYITDELFLNTNHELEELLNEH